MANPFDRFDDAPSGGNPFDRFDAPAVKADPKIGQPEELTFAEKYVAPILEKIGLGEQGAAGAAGISRGGAVGRLAMGAADPGVAVAQLAANAVGQGERVNKRIKQVEDEYQAARGADAGTFDPLRMVGETGMSAFMAAATPAVKLLDRAPALVKAGVQGAGLGVLAPVTDGGDEYWTDKAKQAAVGTGTNVLMSPLLAGLSRLVSPKASVNPNVALLKAEGVNPTVGQTLGGAFNAAEEKAMSMPLVGDMIRNARTRAFEEFNNAALNRVGAPIGAKVEGAGFDAYGAAKRAVSGAYDDAIAKVSHVNFATPTMVAKLGQLENMAATGLPDPLARQFQNLLNENVAKRLSPNGSMLPGFYKTLDSELGQKAANYLKSSTASERDFGSAVKQLQQLFREEVASQSPAFSTALRSADAAFAQGVPVKQAVRSAINTEGVFTPGQLNYAIRKTQGDAASTGTARMQDLARAAQDVIGNKVPNSGSVDRAALIAAALHPHAYVPAALAGAGAYTRPVQNFLVDLIRRRPSEAPAVANYLRRLTTPATIAALPWVQQGVN